MDSARLIINNRDLSTATTATDTPVTGFTVIKAPKGPITPIRIPAGDKAKIQDIFGVLSKDYPDLLEVNTFNEEFDLYVSAPYQVGDSEEAGSRVPVAYVTSEGIFAGAKLIPYTKELEKIALGEATGEEKPLGLAFTDDDEKEVIYKDTRYPGTIGYFSNTKLNDYSGKKQDFQKKEDTSKEIPAYPNWILKNLIIPAGIDAKELSSLIGTKENNYTDAKDIITVLPLKDATEFHYVPGIEFVVKDDESETKYFLSLDPTYTAEAEKNDNIYNTAGKIFLAPAENARGNIVYKDNDVAKLGLKGVKVEDKVIDPEKSTGATLTTAVGYLAVEKKVVDAKEITERFDRAVTFEKESTNVTYNSELPASYIIAGKDYFYKEVAGDSNVTIKESTELTPVNLRRMYEDESERSKVFTAYVDTIKHSEIYAAICPKYPSEREIRLSFDPFNRSKGYNKDTVYGRNLINMTVSEKGSFRGSTKIEASLDETAKNGYDAYLGFNKSISYLDQEFITVFVNKKFKTKDELKALPADLKKYAPVILKGGKRVFPKITEDEAKIGMIEDAKIYDLGWAEAIKDEYADVDIFFESRSYPIVDTDDKLGNTGLTDAGRNFFQVAKEHELAGYFFNRTVNPNLGAKKLDDIIATEKEPMSVGPRYWNVCNQAIVETIGSGERFLSPLTGSKARMQARIIKNRWGGIAPMYLNSGTPSMGGQLPALSGASVVNLRYKYNKNQQMILDALNYNPIIKDSTYGVMSVGQKTCQGGALTDWSYIGHVCSFLNFQKEVRNDVMIPQLGKANNDYYRSLRKQQVEAILARRTTGSNRIWAQGVVDTSTAAGVNDEVNRRARKFIIDVKVKVDIFSEFVELNFTNVDQGVDLV